MKSTVHLFYMGILSTALAVFAACENTAKDNTQEAADAGVKAKPGKVADNPQDGCYVNASGQQMRDTVYVQLHIKKGQVSGRMIDAMWEKDARKGDLKGTVLPDKTIKAVWTFMQEGMTDSINVAFKLDHTGLFQKPLKFDEKTGRQITDESAGYTVALKPAACNK
jgi:hypothetical protein